MPNDDLLPVVSCSKSDTTITILTSEDKTFMDILHKNNIIEPFLICDSKIEVHDLQYHQINNISIILVLAFEGYLTITLDNYKIVEIDDKLFGLKDV